MFVWWTGVWLIGVEFKNSFVARFVGFGIGLTSCWDHVGIVLGPVGMILGPLGTIVGHLDNKLLPGGPKYGI